MSNRFAGVCYVNVDGNPLPVRGNVTVHTATAVRTGIAGLDGVHGYSEVPAVPAIELDISMTEAVDVEAMQALSDGTVMAELANGQVWTLINAWKAGPADINAAEGTQRVRFEGLSIQSFS